MAIDFPASPTVGQIYNFGGVTYTFTAGGVWSTAAAGLAVGIQRFTASGTYTPMAGISYAIIECIGGGGGGGGAAAATSQNYQGGGGGSGGYSRKMVTAAQIGASQVVTIGAAGLGTTSAGTVGGVTSVGSLCIANGGGGGAVSNGGAGGGCGLGATAGTGDVAVAGTPGGAGYYGSNTSSAWGACGNGGTGPFGGGGPTLISQNGGIATSYGGGGAGGHSNNTATNFVGGNGFAGIVIITEYAGSPTGASGGNVVSSGVPLNGQLAQWTSSNTIQGINGEGRLILISSQTIPGTVASVAFTSGIDATYDQYVIEFFNVRPTTEAQLNMNISQDGGATWKTDANNQLAGPLVGAIGSPTWIQSSTNTIMLAASSNVATASGGATCGIIRFSRPTVNEFHIFLIDSACHSSSLGVSRFSGIGMYAGNALAFNGIRFTANVTNLATGTFILYGVKK